MGIMQVLAKPRKEHRLGVCVPEHQKKKIDLEIEEIRQEKKAASVENNAFEVSGYYEVHDLAMVKGTLLRGRITSKNRVLLGEQDFKIREVQQNGRRVRALEEGDSGAVFLKAKGLLIRAGQILDIK